METQTEVQEVQEKSAAPQEEGEFKAPKSKTVQKQKPQQKEMGKQPKAPIKTAPKTKPKTKAPKARPKAILVGSTEATPTSYADILKDLRSNEDLKEIGEKVSRVRRTQKGALLLVLKPGESAKVQDLDEVTTPQEVQQR
uniref:Uncharacterized protein n=1 Tax=Anopheles dirus TaxID=7168 RepID=A0A182NVP8_9DIPT